MKRLLDLWICSPVRMSYRLSSGQRSQVSDGVKRLHPFITVEFQRKCRELDVLSLWKATEFRQFLLYLGPVVLRNIVHPEVYRNFMDLFIAIYVLSHPLFHIRYNHFALSVLHVFVQDMELIYGSKELVYNVHNLVHLADDVREHGVLDNFSAFPFE